MRILLMVVAAPLLVNTTSTCGGHPPATVICGKAIAGANKPFIIDATSGDRTVDWKIDEFWVRLTDSCSDGVIFQVQPPDAASISKQVTATDGKPVAIYLKANQHDFALLLHRHDGTRNTVQFRIMGA